MKSQWRSIFGSFIIASGLMMVAFGVQIAALVLVPLFGIDHTVYYLIQGGYYFANTRVLNEWFSIITIAGIVACSIGIRISRIRRNRS
jgi:uncharacterized membrane protein